MRRTFAARLVVGGVWLHAGAIKLPDPAQSVAALRPYEALPADLVAPVGQLLPVVEVVIGALLVLGLLTRGAALVSAVLAGADEDAVGDVIRDLAGEEFAEGATQAALEAGVRQTPTVPVDGEVYLGADLLREPR